MELSTTGTIVSPSSHVPSLFSTTTSASPSTSSTTGAETLPVSTATWEHRSRSVNDTATHTDVPISLDGLPQVSKPDDLESQYSQNDDQSQYPPQQRKVDPVGVVLVASAAAIGTGAMVVIGCICCKMCGRDHDGPCDEEDGSVATSPPGARRSTSFRSSSSAGNNTRADAGSSGHRDDVELETLSRRGSFPLNSSSTAPSENDPFNRSPASGYSPV